MTEAQAATDLTLDTRDEPWCVEPPEQQDHCYRATTGYVAARLGAGHGRRALVVGSPVFEAVDLAAAEWDVTYVDVRRPPTDQIRFVQADAAALPIRDGAFAALSSSCCLCHAGLGRYGDRVRADGDRLALAEFHRVLGPGGRAAVCYGPAAPELRRTTTMGRVHRVYAVAEALALAEGAGFLVADAALWCSVLGKWLDPYEIALRARREMKPDDTFAYCYLSALLEKP